MSHSFLNLILGNMNQPDAQVVAGAPALRSQTPEDNEHKEMNINHQPAANGPAAAGVGEAANVNVNAPPGGPVAEVPDVEDAPVIINPGDEGNVAPQPQPQLQPNQGMKKGVVPILRELGQALLDHLSVYLKLLIHQIYAVTEFVKSNQMTLVILLIAVLLGVQLMSLQQHGVKIDQRLERLELNTELQDQEIRQLKSELQNLRKSRNSILIEIASQIEELQSKMKELQTRLDESHTKFDQLATGESSTTFRLARAGEGSSATPSCPVGQTIHVVDAAYGTPTGAYNGQGVLTPSVCHRSAADFAAARCNGQASCIVPGNNEIFGDPCFGTVKAILVIYTCHGAAEMEALKRQLDESTKTQVQLIELIHELQSRIDATSIGLNNLARIPPRPKIIDYGYREEPSGYCDALDRGFENDFFRFVGPDRTSHLCVTIAGSTIQCTNPGVFEFKGGKVVPGPKYETMAVIFKELIANSSRSTM